MCCSKSSAAFFRLSYERSPSLCGATRGQWWVDSFSLVEGSQADTTTESLPVDSRTTPSLTHPLMMCGGKGASPRDTEGIIGAPAFPPARSSAILLCASGWCVLLVLSCSMAGCADLWRCGERGPERRGVERKHTDQLLFLRACMCVSPIVARVQQGFGCLSEVWEVFDMCVRIVGYRRYSAGII